MRDVLIVGGGMTGLAAAHHLRQLALREGAAVRPVVVESAASLGGKVLTHHEDGFLLEAGPDAFIPQKPWALELVRELGLEKRLLPSNDAQRQTFVARGRRLLPLPPGMRLLVPARLGELLRSPLLSWHGKLRYLVEPLMPAPAGDGDESVADFVRRRLGQEVLERLAEPLLAHIHAANPERMSLRATYPRLAELERRHGSLRRAGAAMGTAAGTAPRGPIFWSLAGGLGELIEAVAARLDPAATLTGRRALALEQTADGAWRLRLEDGGILTARAVVLAVPAFTAAELTAGLAAELGRRFHAIPYVSLATLSLGYRRADVRHPLAGFGFFVPRRERRATLASTWTSTKFDHRAPADRVLLRVFAGGAGSEALLELDDEALTGRVEADLRELLGLDAAPVLRRVYRFPRGYPQYVVGHGDRVRALEAAMPPGLFLAGSAFHGVGLPDCIWSGRQAAAKAFERAVAGSEDRI